VHPNVKKSNRNFNKSKLYPIFHVNCKKFVFNTKPNIKHSQDINEMSSEDETEDLILLSPHGNFIEVLSKKVERLKVVLWQLVKQFLEPKHSTFTVFRPISGNYTLVQLYEHTPVC